ncbi:acyltransferase [Leifsonia flava]|uniref:Acyltransferase n=1 Tax=Orlajensenia leifsoniae TaxID=2561933 RepID=A0A4Y9R0S5_9MICO|nr:acyltransferase [Leifsonia flava]TFV96956.1 acyltransferase [Leifsonia flava]
MKTWLARVSVGTVRTSRRWVLWGKSHGHIEWGEKFVVGPRARVARGVDIAVGDRVNIGADVVVQTHLEIGDDVMVSSSVAFIGNDHDFSDPALSIQQQPLLERSRILLGGDNLIGFGTTILGNVTIGRGVIVGAGSLVTSDLPADTVCVGRPAKPVRARR